ncbi:DNA-methyltransferase [Solimonas marina]|uniref:Methyltransferase n=1 Tax=Solimonas marina TaxID=2714601 RepID=A0A970B3R2_9GAMM|nr:site-specific DNA-methyltransferase [Solimonas marina]NKF21532.1 site-specific DNA-methyltransferase [Solimonas marina]
MSIRIITGDCREVLRALEDESIDSIVTDPPYELGFMGKKWDQSGVAFDPKTWRQALRVLKPGGHLLAFGGARTYHRMASAIEDAGFEIRDQIMWIYGSGFPKNFDVSKAIDKAAGAERSEIVGSYRARDLSKCSNNRFGSVDAEVSSTIVSSYAPATATALQWQGWGTALKPAHEPIVVARKPLSSTVAANVLAYGTGALNIDACRVAGESMPPNAGAGGLPRRSEHEQRGGGFVSQPHQLGRWPANVLHDGSEDVVSAFPDAPGQMADTSLDASVRKTQNVYGAMRSGRGPEPSADSANEGSVGFKIRPGARRLDEGSAARFFYCAKATTAERGEGNTHPTVKPIALMRWLLRLITPPGGTALDMFAGSGTTGVAAQQEQFDAVLIEEDPAYVEIIVRRLRADSPLLANIEVAA